jgi:integrase
MNKEDKPDIARGFDRNVDYKIMRKQLINSLMKELENLKTATDKTQRIVIHRIIYNLIAIIQLRNGSRISEAVDAMCKFNDGKKYNERMIVKIAKSETIKYKKDTGEQYTTKKRYRKIIFPKNWFDFTLIEPILDDINTYILNIKPLRLRKRVLDYLLKYHKCNTHSLRYACINYLLYSKKLEMGIVAKFVGHSNVNQLVTYTQLKNTDKIFDLDI